PIPVYKCLGGGDVTVLIAVDPRGYVVAADVVREFSSSDPCLNEYAIRAARTSRFSASANAPQRQQGEIVYRFIAQ
ncbi:MAG: energy transducer TonB, partial [Bacteroidales bacterium]|nr:energy transducer TonB [Bacteroidales bacterium]